MLLALGSLKLSTWALFRRLVPAVAVVLFSVHLNAARAEEGSSNPIVALAFDNEAKALLKSDGVALYRSADGGASWQIVPLPPNAQGKVTAIATPADRKGIVYVAGPGLGVLRTEDDGAHWTALNDGLPDTQVAGLTAHATQPDTVYAYLPERGIYRSQDAGKSWRLMDRGPERIGQLIHSNLAGSMESGWLYAATDDGVQLAMDCFCFWRDAGSLDGAVRAVSFDPSEPKQVYAASEHGLFRSIDGGQTWEAATPLAPTVTAVLVTPPGTVFAATGDGKLYRSTDRAATWEPVGG